MQSGIPDVLFHVALGGHDGCDKNDIDEVVKSIMVEGIKPQIATEYNLLIPEGIRHLPVVWLMVAVPKRKYGVFIIKTEHLVLERLYHIQHSEVNWWVYQGCIPLQMNQAG